mmetsp:Transcript_67548/g.93950  ORF Transcript_67548/g.93950 Transcript_67548/m.93950 type:complete len:222 (-) Transcript_67548:24-689(-)
MGLPLIVRKELLRLAQSLFKFTVRIHDVSQWPSSHSCPMRRVTGHPILHKSPLRAVRAFNVDVSLKSSARLIAIYRLPMELCLLEMISEAITSSFHKGLLRGPKSRKGLVLPVQARAMRLDVLPLFEGQVVLEHVVEVNRVSICLLPSQLSHINASDHVSFCGAYNPLAFMGAVYVPVGCLLFRWQRTCQERLLPLGSFDLNAIEVGLIQGRCACLTYQKS